MFSYQHRSTTKGGRPQAALAAHRSVLARDRGSVGDESLGEEDLANDTTVTHESEDSVRLLAGQMRGSIANGTADAAAAAAAADVSITANTSTAAKSQSGWMEKSRFRSYFTISYVAGRKTAACIYCGKVYKEGESTGNLSKHITNVHAVQYRPRENRVSKKTAPDTGPAAKRTGSLQLSGRLAAEMRSNPGAFVSVALATELLLPPRSAESASWGMLANMLTGASLVTSADAMVGKLDSYLRDLDESLAENLEKSAFVNVHLGSWAAANGRSYIGVSASFAPNILDEEGMQAARDARVLLGSHGEPANCHLLDFAELGDQGQTDGEIDGCVLNILRRFGIAEKIATITVDRTPGSAAFHSRLVEDHLKIMRPEVFQLVGGVRLIRCASHMLDALLQQIVETLAANEPFETAFSKLAGVAEEMDRNPMLRASVEKLGVPCLPSGRQARGTDRWQQMDVFLRHREGYLNWYIGSGSSRQLAVAKKQIRELVTHTSEIVGQLQYFVDCCAIFKSYSDVLQKDENNSLLSGVPMCYTLSYFFGLCERAARGVKIPKAADSNDDFSFLSEPAELPLTARRAVLDAVLASRKSFETYFEHLKANPLYYVAAILDPTSDFENLQRVMAEEEAEARLQQVDTFVRSYLRACESLGRNTVAGAAGATPASSPVGRLQTAPRTHSSPKSFFKVNIHSVKLLPTEGDLEEVEDTTKNNSQRPAKQPSAEEDGALKEWELYTQEDTIYDGSRQDALQWWYDHRLKYPNLFTLALSLFYTRLSTSGAGGPFSASEQMAHPGCEDSGAQDERTVTLLKGRFAGFALYDTKLEPANPGALRSSSEGPTAGYSDAEL